MGKKNTDSTHNQEQDGKRTRHYIEQDDGLDTGKRVERRRTTPNSTEEADANIAALLEEKHQQYIRDCKAQGIKPQE